MKKYQIYETTSTVIQHAVSKAPSDVATVAEKLGFERLLVTKLNDGQKLKNRVIRQRKFAYDWYKAYREIEKNSVVLLQHPFRTRQIGRQYYLSKLKDKKNVKFISLIHDIEELRQVLYNEYYKEEFNFMLDVATVIIVHNDSMKEELIKRGVNKNKIVVLEIFDYLREDNLNTKAAFSKNVTIAGNLSPDKSKYINKLKNLNIFFDLYGPNFNLNNERNYEYHGVLAANKLPDVLNKGFGLVWDGTSIDECNGPTGNYLRYNNPHKLSLYLASNLPVIIWKEAAEAKFVEKNKVGITVSSLKELESILANLSEKEYNEYATNALKVGKKLVNGYYTEMAINKALGKIKIGKNE